MNNYDIKGQLVYIYLNIFISTTNIGILNDWDHELGAHKSAEN